MKYRQLLHRNLIFYWRTNLPIVAGIAAAVAVLSGALLVGQSVRDSLRRLLYERIGSTEYVVTADHFFREALARSLAAENPACPIIHLKGVVTHEENGIRAHAVNVYGVDERFWEFHKLASPGSHTDRDAFVGLSLARQLGAVPGDGLLLRVEAQQDVPREWLYGRRDNVGRTIRLNFRSVQSSDELGDFSLRPTQGNVYVLFVPLARLQKDLGQPARVNTMLFSRPPAGGAPALQNDLARLCTLQDFGLKLRPAPQGNGFFLESNRVILDDWTARAAVQTATENKLNSAVVYTYLANSIRAKGRAIPYSAVAAADIGKGALASIAPSPSAPPENPDESIWLTDWAAAELDVSGGETIEMDYYFWQAEGSLETRTARFRFSGAVPIAGDLNEALTPQIPGITGARSMGSWDPPFPLDLGRIRTQDENFWNRHRATPKAFITLARGQQLWANRFGKQTAVRIAPDPGAGTQLSPEDFENALRDKLDPSRLGFTVYAVEEQGAAAAKGSTDFGEYFVYFSSFLILASILLAALFFKLMIEQRVREIGILRAAGFAASHLRRIFLGEGAVLTVAGSILGVLGSLGYGWLMVLGLRTWWVGAVGTRSLSFHLSWTGLGIGTAGGILLSMVFIVWTLRTLERNSPRMLLTGALESSALQSRRARGFRAAGVAALVAAGCLLLCSFMNWISPLAGFFGAGFILLVSMLCLTGAYLRKSGPGSIRGNGLPALFRLGLRNASHRPARSLLCAGLIASATFIVISMEAFRRDPGNVSLDPKSGTGGFSFLAQSDLPIVFDLNTDAGREAAGVSEGQNASLKKVSFVSFRERPGDDASCLNLYAPQEPRILGVPQDSLSGRFSFQDSLATSEWEKEDPWRLLQSPADASAIPAIADANTIQYILHKKLGDMLTVRGSDGANVRLRLVAALKDSIFQGEILISQVNFLRVFPDQEGYRFFLLSMPIADSSALAQLLKEALSDWGFQTESTRERLASFHKVENTYISTFQSLGSLGLILGTVGLAAVLLRNVMERRRELALLRAVGYRKSALSLIILSENIVLMLWGLASGTACAFVAVLPALYIRGTGFPVMAAGAVLTGVLAAGLLSSLVAVTAAFRSPLLTALRSE